MKQVTYRHAHCAGANSPGLNNREWIETLLPRGSYLPLADDSPGLNNREWIETCGWGSVLTVEANSPGLNNREWIETLNAASDGFAMDDSPGLNNREWIETSCRNEITPSLDAFSRFK